MLKKIQISERTLFARVARKCIKEKKFILKKCRADQKLYADLGAYYAVSLLTHNIEITHIDLLLWAQRLGSIKPYEELIYA